MTGHAIAHYVILEKLGEGGMGVVYKARDIHLDRLVALKILPEDSVADADRVHRFIQEAKAASALNHPNIVTIYDIDSADGSYFIAMEYVPGKTLERTIGHKGLRVADALRYAVQVADALSKAHAAGIVHRDLKPANVMVSEDGSVKLLDFGLAKLTETIGPEDETATLQTADGAILGTVAYMSPEQAEGKPVDSRSDVFSFGSVLYEMLTGRRAFTGETRLSTPAAVQQAVAPRLPETLPRDIDRVLQRCLKRDPQRRWQTMSDLKVALEELREESDSGTLEGKAAGPRGSRRFPVTAAVAALLAVGAAAAWWFLRGSGRPVEMQPARLTFDSGFTTNAVISPDGKLAVYSSDRSGEGNADIWVQQLAGREPMRLTHNGFDNGSPSFSADGSRVAFRSERDGGGIYVIDTLGGSEQKIVDGGTRPIFSPDGAQIAFARPAALSGMVKLFLVSSRGGPPRRFQPEFSIFTAGGFIPCVTWSPDGKLLLFEGMRGQDVKTRDWWIAPISGGPATATGALQVLGGANLIRILGAWTGRYIYYLEGAMVESTDLYRVPIIAGTWQIHGPPQQLTRSTLPYSGVSIAANGELLLSSFQAQLDCWSVGLDADSGRVSGDPQRVVSDSAVKAWPACSRNGRFLAYVRWAGLRTHWRVEVHVRDLRSGTETVYAGSGAALAMEPRLNVDGSMLSYSDLVDGKWESYVVSQSTGVSRKICAGCTVVGFLPGGKEVIVLSASRDFARYDLETGGRSPMLTTTVSAYQPDLSPDGTWITFTDGATAYIASLKTRKLISIANDSRLVGSPRWSPNGKILYYISSRDGWSCVWGQRLDSEMKEPVGESFAVFHAHGASRYRGMPLGMRTIAVSVDRLFLPFIDVKGNIWTAKVEP